MLRTACGWPAQFGLATPSLVLPRQFRRLRVLSRPADDRRLRRATAKILDRDGIGGVLSDVFGVNGLRILEGIVAKDSREKIIASLSRHVQTRHAKLSPTTLARTVGRSCATCCHAHASEKIAHYDKLIREGLEG